MDYIGMTNEEIISMFEERLNTNKVVRVEDLKAALATRSIVDYKASADAIAMFYSGESEDLINFIAANEGSNIRMIRRTEAFQFLAS